MGPLVAVAAGISVASAIAASRSKRQFFADRQPSLDAWFDFFPGAIPEEIDHFLDDITDWMLIESSKKALLRPDDTLMSIYRAYYPERWTVGDACELETVWLETEKRHGIDLEQHWHEDLTLADLLTLIREAA